MREISIQLIKLLNDETAKYEGLEALYSPEEFFEVKKRLTASINSILNKFKPDKWEIRETIKEVFGASGITLEENSVKKVIFLILTEVINERIPSPSPLVFEYKGNLIPKRHAVVTDFELFPFLKEETEKLNPEKKHLLVFDIFTDGRIVSEGVSYYINVIDYILFLLLDKALYEEVISLDKIIKEENNNVDINKEQLSFLLQALFSGLFEFYSGKKETFKTSILNKERAQEFVKAKKLVKSTLSDKREEKYIIDIAISDEKLSENRKEYVKEKEVQENIFSEAKKREVPEVDKIDAVVWLIGLENIQIPLFFKYFSLEDFVSFIKILEKDITTDVEYFTQTLENFFKRLFNYPQLYKTLENTSTLDKLIEEKFPELYPELLFFKGEHNRFLENAKKNDLNDELKILFSKYKTGEIDSTEFKNWLTLYETKENIDKDLLEFVKNG